MTSPSSHSMATAPLLGSLPMATLQVYRFMRTSSMAGTFLYSKKRLTSVRARSEETFSTVHPWPLISILRLPMPAASSLTWSMKMSESMHPSLSCRAAMPCGRPVPSHPALPQPCQDTDRQSLSRLQATPMQAAWPSLILAGPSLEISSLQAI